MASSQIDFEDIILGSETIGPLILRNLDKSDLLNCSLVSRQVNWISREFLRRHHKCLILICLPLDKEEINIHPQCLKTTLPTLPPPFNGVEICQLDPEIIVEEHHPNGPLSQQLFDGLIPISYLFLEFLNEPNTETKNNIEEYLTCLPLQQLENLEIGNDVHSWKCLLSFMHGKQFQSLQTIETITPQNSSLNLDLVNMKHDRLTTIQVVLESCPNLKKWFYPTRVAETLEFIRLKKDSVIKSLVINRGASFEDIRDIARARLQLTNLKVVDATEPDNIRMILWIIKQNSQVLRRISLPQNIFEILFRNISHFPTLVKVKIVELTQLSKYSSTLNISNSTRIFPNAKLKRGEEEK